MTRNTKRQKKKFETTKSVKIIPIGGLEQIGQNMTLIEYDKDIIIIDCGIAFPNDDMPGINKIIPDISYLKANLSKVKAMIITHGHEDHIGAIPSVINELNVPIYGTKLTIELIKDKLNRAGIGKIKTNIVGFGDRVSLGSFNVEFIKTNHSIQDAAALAISTPYGMIVHTGDFKIDYTPVFGDRINLNRFAEIGNDGVLAALSDSTNATKGGFTQSERIVGKTFDVIFGKHTNSRIIVGTFSSNVDRVQQIIDTAYKYKRKVVIDGRSMKNIISIASRLGYVKIPENTLINVNDVTKYDDSEVVIIATGSQGESMASLSKMSTGTHKIITIKPNDVIVLSSTPIPGNEKAVANIISRLTERNAEIIIQDTHVSGHACQEELKLIFSLLKPKYLIPLHGDYRQRYAAKQIAEEVGVEKECTMLLKDGDVLTINDKDAWVTGSVSHEKIMIDLLGARDVDGRALKDRQRLSNGGIIIISLTVDAETGLWCTNPMVTSLGLSRSEKSAKLFFGIREELSKQMRKHPICLEEEHKFMRNKINRAMELFIHYKTGLDTIVFTSINLA